MQRKQEYFKEDLRDEYGTPIGTVCSSVRAVYPQERDWTCSIACLRTLLSASKVNISEDELISKCNISVGPKNSADVSEWEIVKDIKILTGYEHPVKENVLRELTMLMVDYNIMVECMVNYAHWIVLLAYVDLGDIEKDIIVYYDPYYNRVNEIIADEFASMWYDVGERPIQHDYVAIPKED